ncbi:MAG TPA: hypothetical protein DDX14_01135, partial [Cyanobacteria bacterium UBA9579]|nr:hypothetical protein [Cyanobacteria bacterium UBA9579]
IAGGYVFVGTYEMRRQQSCIIKLYNHNIITKINEFKFVPLAPGTEKIYSPKLMKQSTSLIC